VYIPSDVPASDPLPPEMCEFDTRSWVGRGLPNMIGRQHAKTGEQTASSWAENRVVRGSEQRTSDLTALQAECRRIEPPANNAGQREGRAEAKSPHSRRTRPHNETWNAFVRAAECR